MLKTILDSNRISSTYLRKGIPFLIFIVILIIVMPIKIPFSVSVNGKVFPAQEWIIMKGRNGQLITLLKDYKTGLSKSYSVTEFERGDNASFIIKSDIQPGSVIGKSDTIGSIVSNELEVRLSSLRGQLDITKKMLNSSTTGEKKSIIQEAKDNLDYAKKRAEVERKIYSRQEQLFQKGLISEQAYDSSKYTVELSEVSIAIAEAQLNTAITGEKPEQIEFIKSQISAFEKDINVLEKRSSSYNFTSPVDGYVSDIQIGDTLMIISDTSNYIIAMAIPLAEKPYLNLDANVLIISSIDDLEVEATLKRVNNSVQYPLTGPVVNAVACSEESNNHLLTGLLVECRIKCGSLSVFEHARRIMRFKIF
jgi:hypothetical protein